MRGFILLFSFLGAWTIALYALPILRIVLTVGSCDQPCCCSLVIAQTLGKNWHAATEWVVGHNQDLSEWGREGMSNSKDLEVRDLRDYLVCSYCAHLAKGGTRGAC